MNKPWYDRDPESYSALREEVESVYTELHFLQHSEDVFVVGYYPIFEGDRVWDRYQIKLQLSQISSLGLPTVFEIGNRIPRTPDRHMESNGRACIVLPDAFWYEHPEGMTLLEFLNGPIRWYFSNQSLIDSGELPVWKGREWGHGAAGIIEFYAAILGTSDSKIILTYLDILKHVKIKGHWLCPCGSKKRLRNCHQALINEIMTRIPQTVAAESEKRLAAHLAKSRPSISSGFGG